MSFDAILDRRTGETDSHPSRLSRRGLLQGALSTSALAVTATLPGATARAADDPKPAPAKAASDGKPHFRGVNLGNWLVLEKWIAPSVFEKSGAPDAHDEYTLCEKLGKSKAQKVLQAHRDTYITEADFAQIAKWGLNAVRLPVGYWVLDPVGPFVEGRETLDRAFAWAEKHDLKVILDLHGAPGSQNGNDHSGRSGPLEWDKKPENVARTLDVLEDLAAHYKGQKSLAAIELLNEPRWDVPLKILKPFYEEGYRRVRKHIPARQAAVMFHDGFRPQGWAEFMPAPEFENAILDTHIYQCFTDDDRKRTGMQQIQRAAVDHPSQIAMMERSLWTTVGEWSLGLPGESYAGLSETAKEALNRSFAAAQLLAYEQASAGWFFWTYKTESGGGWSLTDCIKRGWMPEQYG